MKASAAGSLFSSQEDNEEPRGLNEENRYLSNTDSVIIPLSQRMPLVALSRPSRLPPFG